MTRATFNLFFFNPKKHAFIAQLVFIVSSMLILSSCDGDYRKSAVGPLGNVIVLTDTTNFFVIDSLGVEDPRLQTDPIAKVQYALIEVFEQGMPSSPGFESAYNTRYVSFETAQDLEQLKRSRTLVIAAPLEDKTASGQFLNALLDAQVKDEIKAGRINYIPLYNKWYKDQITLILTAPTYAELADYLLENKSVITRDLDRVELERYTYEVYKKKEQTQLADSLWDKYGFKVRVQHDYLWNVDTTNFVSFRRYMPENDRWFWIHWIDGVEDTDFVDQLWINNTRDQLLRKYIQGTNPDTYLQTEYERPIAYEERTLNDKEAFSVEGTWKLVNGAMGGGFIHLTVYDEVQKRLYLTEYMVFAPGFKKRPFLRQFQAMSRTFETDPSFKPNFKAESSLNP